MKLKDSYLAVRFENSSTSTFWWKQLADDFMLLENRLGTMPEELWTEDGLAERLAGMKEIAEKTPDHKVYLVSRNVQEHAAMITNDKVDLGWFLDAKKRSGTYVLDKNSFIRWRVLDGYIRGIHCHVMETERGTEIKYNSFGIDTVDKHVSGVLAESQRHMVSAWMFIKLYMFIELAEVQLLLVKAKGRANFDDFDGEKKILNETDVDVVTVNTLWNYTIRTTGFDVRGHLRIQPYGHGRTQYKLIFINGFRKEGYNRKAGKLAEETHSET